MNQFEIRCPHIKAERSPQCTRGSIVMVPDMKPIEGHSVINMKFLVGSEKPFPFPVYQVNSKFLVHSASYGSNVVQTCE